jgi:hypothetical protein
MFTGIIFYFVPQRKQWRGDKLGGADHWISLLLEITCSETSSCATFADAPPVCAFARRVATALYGNQYRSNETVVYRAALTFHCGSGGETVLSTLHRLQGNKIRWPESTKFHATQACVCVGDVEEGWRLKSSELLVAKSGNCLRCHNPTRQWVSLFVRTGLVTSLWFEISKDQYERSHDLPYRYPVAVAVYVYGYDMKC